MENSYKGTSSGSKYQVFLSFRGPDTREGFTDVLFHYLSDAGICVFRDDELLRVGERINGSLQQAIDNSRIYIPIFSRNYASSQWCLRELTHILANTSRSKDNKKILPIFFDVEPDDVKLKTALYGDVILSLQCEKEWSNEEVDAWRKALKEVGAIKGWEVKKYNGQGKLIKLVVEEVVKKLKTKHKPVTEELVRDDDQVVAVSELLDINSDEVRLIKIYGMGGIGKTTMAKIVFNELSSHFGKCCCFLENVREKSSRTNGLVELQKKLLSEISHYAGSRGIDESDYGKKRVEEILCNKKVLIVLDDVDNMEQVEKLIGERNLYPGSRILITTRNKDINTPKYQILDYEMEVMNTDRALELFSRHAFGSVSPPNDYNDLSRKIVLATGRLPLTLEVTGSFLCRKKTIEQWKETLDRLRKGHFENVYEKLKISYDALSFEQKQIFLDIACFFIGEDKTYAIYVWEDCNFFPHTGVEKLISLSLVKILENNVFWMHDQLRDLGRTIVRMENPMNPGERSRIWTNKEALDAIQTKEIKKNVQALYLDIHARDSPNVVVQSEEIGRFEDLRFLKLSGGIFVGNFENHLTKLRWLSWNLPPGKHEWANLHLKNMVVLKLSSNVYLDDSRLQDLIQMARKLKVLFLLNCAKINGTLDFSGCLDLERLIFSGCFNLRKIDGSIGKLKCLIDLSIVHCESIEYLPKEIGDLVNLRHFTIKYCAVRNLPHSIWKLRSLCEVYFIKPKKASGAPWELHRDIGILQNLEVLEVDDPYLKGQIPSGIGRLSTLRILNLSGTNVSEVPKTISMLPCLQRLKLKHCDKIQELPMLPISLTHLEVSSTSLWVVPNLSNSTNLIELTLDGVRGEGELCTGELRWIGKLSKLKRLSLRLNNVHAPAELASLPQLNELYMSRLDLQTCPQLPLSLEKLYLDTFISTLSNLRNLSFFCLRESPMQEIQIDGFQLPYLRELQVVECEALESIGLSSMRKLRVVKVNRCGKLIEIQFSWASESLEYLVIYYCRSLKRLVCTGEAGHANNGSADEMISCEGRLILPMKALKKLRGFELLGSNEIFEIHIVGSSASREVFYTFGCPSLRSLRGLQNLKNLRFLSLLDCRGLQVVEGLDQLECLSLLRVSDCESLERLIDLSTTKLPDDCDIHIGHCKKLCGFEEGFMGPLQSYKQCGSNA
ncbi:hypothetical protein ACJRO7_017697 [Eucalyptus globulus]|uniref:TIR domain-containing protein n=1 Tax=Eucalyptus globulus TaxID=34317 RepID=A0ABD3KVG6_EUCGL